MSRAGLVISKRGAVGVAGCLSSGTERGDGCALQASAATYHPHAHVIHHHSSGGSKTRMVALYYLIGWFYHESWLDDPCNVLQTMERQHVFKIP